MPQDWWNNQRVPEFEDDISIKREPDTKKLEWPENPKLFEAFAYLDPISGADYHSFVWLGPYLGWVNWETIYGLDSKVVMDY